MADSSFDELYSTPRGSLEYSRQSIYDEREESADWLDSYYKQPEQIGYVSDRIDELLSPDSEYLLEAQKRSEEQRTEAGYLDSGFNKGIGTVEAIDNAFDVALSDVYTDAFNADEINKQYREEYTSAYESMMKNLQFQDNISVKENLYNNLVNSLDELQQDKLELQDKDFEYNSLLLADKQENDMNRLYLYYSNQLANSVARNKSGLQRYYLTAFTNIMRGDIPQADKYNQLVGLASQIGKATDQAVGQQEMKVGNNPYDISYIESLPEYNIGSPTDEAFVFSADDAKFVFNNDFYPLWKDITYQIHSQTNHQERDASSLWTVVADVIPATLFAIPKNSQGFKDAMEFFDRNKYAMNGGNQQIENVMNDLVRLSQQSLNKNQYNWWQPNTPVVDDIYSYNSVDNSIDRKVTSTICTDLQYTSSGFIRIPLCKASETTETIYKKEYYDRQKGKVRTQLGKLQEEYPFYYQQPSSAIDWGTPRRVNDQVMDYYIVEEDVYDWDDSWAGTRVVIYNADYVERDLLTQENDFGFYIGPKILSDRKTGYLYNGRIYSPISVNNTSNTFGI